MKETALQTNKLKVMNFVDVQIQALLNPILSRSYYSASRCDLSIPRGKTLRYPMHKTVLSSSTGQGAAEK